MYLTTIAGGSGNTYHDVQGNTLILTGNDRLWPGRQVWTDGHYIFSFVQQADIPPKNPVISTVGIYPFYNPNCAFWELYNDGSVGALCSMSDSGKVNELATNIRQGGGV